MYKVMLIIIASSIMCHASFLENSLSSFAKEMKNQVNSSINGIASTPVAETKNDQIPIETDLDKAINNSEMSKQKLDDFTIRFQEIKQQCNEIRYMENYQMHYDSNTLKTFYNDAPNVNAKIKASNQNFIESNKNIIASVLELTLTNHEKSRKSGRFCSQIEPALARYNLDMKELADYVYIKGVKRSNIVNVRCETFPPDKVIVINDPCPEVPNLEYYVEDIKKAYQIIIEAEKAKALKEEQQALAIQEERAEIEKLEKEEKAAHLQRIQNEQKANEEAAKLTQREREQQKARLERQNKEEILEKMRIEEARKQREQLRNNLNTKL